MNCMVLDKNSCVVLNVYSMTAKCFTRFFLRGEYSEACLNLCSDM